MIKQEAIGLNSRQEANIYDENGMLPLMTAPMFSVVNEDNCKIFLDNGVRVCMPRNTGFDGELEYMQNEKVFTSCSLQDFIKLFIDEYDPINDTTLKQCICVDVANGNMPALHEAIRKAKEIHGSNLIIMAGNVASEDAFVELAKTGVDYIRVGIGGGGGCNTTSNTGVGQEDLRQLIGSCKNRITRAQNSMRIYEKEGAEYYTRAGIPANLHKKLYHDEFALSQVKIVADGISSYIKQCEEKYGFNDNGYAAINTLIYAGADIVMIGKLFAQCLESAGEKRAIEHWGTKPLGRLVKEPDELDKSWTTWEVKYSGMSALQEQEKYKDGKWGVYKNSRVPNSKHPYQSRVFNTEQEAKDYAIELSKGNLVGFTAFSLDKKPSEGSVQWIPVRWSLPDWLTGNDAQDSYPYLMGFVNSLKSAMSYTGNKTI